jgi:hypothetical protein
LLRDTLEYSGTAGVGEATAMLAYRIGEDRANNAGLQAFAALRATQLDSHVLHTREE